MFGKGSYILSLPKDWIIKNKLKKGSVLSIDANTTSLLISTNLVEQETVKRTNTISADNKNIHEIETEIITSYLTGYDAIEIISKKMNDIDTKIKEIIMNLAGLEILEHTHTRLVARYLMDTREISLDSLIRRMDNITRSLIIDAINCIDGELNYISVKQRDMDVNRLHFLIIRTVRESIESPKLSKSGSNVWQLFTNLIVGEKLEKIADRQKRIARCLQRLKLSEEFAKELRKAYENIQNSYIEVMTAYYKGDKKAALNIELSNRERVLACDHFLGEDIKKEYELAKQCNSHDLTPHINEHMIITEIVSNLKAMATSVKAIARAVMNN
jgi:phosphate uptake regulator